MPDPTKCRRVTSIVALFLFVPVQSFLHKMTYAQQAVGRPDKPAHRFVKPWFQTGLMFVGMSVSLAIYMIMTCVNRTKYPVFTSIGWRKVLFLAIPTLLDLISTVLTAVGVIYLGVSVVAILNTSKALFSALCRALVFKKPIFAHQWLGMGVMALAILTVGSSAFFIDVAIVNPPSNGVIFGALGGKLVAEFARALKMSLEQKVLQEDSVNPLIAVGLEGCFGLVITLAVFYPIFQFVPAAEGSGLHEDLVDTFLMMRNNHTIIALASVAVVMVLLFNICLMTLVKTTNAVLAAFYDIARVAMLWIIQLITYYSLSGTKFDKYKMLGESWTKWSFLELGGFATMAIGIFIYQAVIRFPCITYRNVDQEHFPYKALRTKRSKLESEVL